MRHFEKKMIELCKGKKESQRSAIVYAIVKLNKELYA